jgi:hypothetical protein
MILQESVGIIKKQLPVVMMILMGENANLFIGCKILSFADPKTRYAGNTSANN